jgi:hypothetical protein
MELNYGAIIVATVVQFIVGAIWYMPLFGKLWGEIHGFNTLTPEEQKAAQKHMLPLLALQLLLTLVTSFVFAVLLGGFPNTWNIYGIAGFFWLGFVMPAQVSAVIFGGTEPSWVVKKIAVSIGASLVCYLSAATVFVFLR